MKRHVFVRFYEEYSYGELWALVDLNTGRGGVSDVWEIVPLFVSYTGREVEVF